MILSRQLLDCSISVYTQSNAYVRHRQFGDSLSACWRGWLRGQLIQRTLQCHVLPIFIKRTKCYDYILRHQLAGFDI